MKLTMKIQSTLIVFAFLSSLANPASAARAKSNGKLKVFILAGQSNMQGHGVVKADARRNGGKGSLGFIARAEKTKKRLAHTINENGQWVVRDDVFIWYLDRSGQLTAGFGASQDHIGPEFQFGHAVGDYYEDPVLLIKLAWGGKSVAVDFRSPSAGGETGDYYKLVLEHTKEVLGNLKKHYPAYDGKGYELMGIGWHQGWNDRVNQAHNDAYEENLTHFIKDIRRDLDAKHLPFVIAETGMSGHKEKHPRALSLMKHQAAVAKRPEFKGTVSFVGTKDFFRPKEDSPSGQAYHWNTNAETYFLIGDAMAKSMISLLK